MCPPVSFAILYTAPVTTAATTTATPGCSSFANQSGCVDASCKWNKGKGTCGDQIARLPLVTSYFLKWYELEDSQVEMCRGHDFIVKILDI